MTELHGGDGLCCIEGGGECRVVEGTQIEVEVVKVVYREVGVSG